MIYGLYAIRDKYTTFLSPALDQTNESAKRNFGFAVNNNKEISYAAADYDFYKVGEFDSISGKVTPADPIEFICNGVEVFNEKSES